jgi:DNA-directed RNA polymerase specialized sigma24 family protein
MDDYNDLLRRQDWAALSRRLTRYAHTALKGKSWADAEDVASEVITRVFDPKRRAWDRERHPEIFDHLAWDLRDHVLPNRRKKRSTRAEVPHHHAALERIEHGDDAELGGLAGKPDRSEPPDARRPSGPLGASPEAIVTREERRRGAHDALVRSLADDPIALGLIALVEDGVEGREACAAALGCSLAAVKAARQRIGERLARIRGQDDEDEDDDG